jgi:hypothetical protein
MLAGCFRLTLAHSNCRPIAIVTFQYRHYSSLPTHAMSQYNLRQRQSAVDLKRGDRIGSTITKRQIGDREHSSNAGGSHSHDHAHGAGDAEALLSAMKGSADPGSRITLIGLGANVGLTGVKGVAGLMLGSAALLADAAHSGSDLLADVVTLTTYRMSRRPISKSHPYGYGSKFNNVEPTDSQIDEEHSTEYESLGSLVMSALLIGTAFGIGA